MSKRVLFMGTPEIAAIIFEKLIAAKDELDIEIIGAVTQPDKPKGRGMEMKFSEVKEVALKNNIQVYQPVKVKEEEFIKVYEELAPELVIVAAFGQILPKKVLDLPKYGCINVHTSLLPMYRGAAPIQWAVIDGQKYSGVTIMYMNEGLDTGDIILQEKIELAADETGGSLYDKLAAMGGDVLIKAVAQIFAGRVNRIPQEGETCYAKMLNKELGHIDYKKSAVEIERLVRGLFPWPGTFSFINGKTLKIKKVRVVHNSELSGGNSELKPGEIFNVTKKSFFVNTGDGALEITRLQLEGKKEMDTESFLRGYKIENGNMLE